MSTIFELLGQEITGIYDSWIRLYKDFLLIDQIEEGIHARKENSGIFFETLYMLKFYFYRDLCLEIRRTLDSTSNRKSLRQILLDLKKHKDEFTLSKNIERLKIEKWRDDYLENWKKFSNEANDEQLSDEKLNAKIQDLKNCYEPVKDFVDQNIAHRPRAPSVLSVSNSKIWQVCEDILQCMSEVNLLLRFRETQLEPHFDYDRHQHLRIPWWDESFIPTQKSHLFGKKMESLS